MIAPFLRFENRYNPQPVKPALWWPRRSPRNAKLLTPSGPEGSSGDSGVVCRGVAGVATTLYALPLNGEL